MTTDAGTVAADVLLEVKFTVMLAGAGPERFSVRFCVLPEPTEMADGVNERAEPTTTSEESPVNPAAEAEMLELPNATPVMVTGTAGAVLPAAMVTVFVTVTLELLLLESAMITPPEGAGLAKVTWIGFVWPGATVTFFSTEICPKRLDDIGALPVV